MPLVAAGIQDYRQPVANELIFATVKRRKLVLTVLVDFPLEIVVPSFHCLIPIRCACILGLLTALPCQVFGQSAVENQRISLVHPTNLRIAALPELPESEVSKAESTNEPPALTRSRQAFASDFAAAYSQIGARQVTRTPQLEPATVRDPSTNASNPVPIIELEDSSVSNGPRSPMQPIYRTSGNAWVQPTFPKQSVVVPAFDTPTHRQSVPAMRPAGDVSVDGELNVEENVFSSSAGDDTEAHFQTAVKGLIGAPESLAWWKQQVLAPIHSPNNLKNVDSNTLVYETLKQSPRIRALSQNPLVRELQVIEADAEFDPVSFVRSQFQDRVDPVGDSLSVTSDGSDFLQNHIWSADAGVRKKARTGASYELSQTLGFKNSNSSFFTPQDQGTATLALNVTQPLLRGRGRYYNQSQILIAQSAGGVAWNAFIGELQDEIQKTVEAYWRLYYDRSVYLQKRRNVVRGEAILQALEGRRGLDSLPSQIARARSAVQSRRTDLANALRDIRDSETEIRRLTADRNWQANQFVELLPIESPSNELLDLKLDQVVFTALDHRPEIKETMTRAKIAGIQREISVNELMPELSLLLGTYVSALKGDSQLGQAIQDQFGAVKPGYSVGVEFEMPIYNRAAKSRLTQRNLQVAKIRSEVDEAMQNVIAESQIALRRVSSAAETLEAATMAIAAARDDLEQNFRRWESFALIEGDLADGQTPTTVLDQLLDSQERLTAAELVFAQAELELKIAQTGLQRTMGTLLIHENVSFAKTYQDGNPTLEFGGQQ